MRDPFVPSRTACIMALTATNSYYDSNEISCKILPNLSPLLIDQDKSVREACLKAMQQFMIRIEESFKSIAKSDEKEELKPIKVENGWQSWAFSSAKKLSEKIIKTDSPKVATSRKNSTKNIVTKSEQALTNEQTTEDLLNRFPLFGPETFTSKSKNAASIDNRSKETTQPEQVLVSKQKADDLLHKFPPIAPETSTLSSPVTPNEGWDVSIDFEEEQKKSNWDNPWDDDWK